MKIIISERNKEPEREVAIQRNRHLQAKGLTAFIDRDLPVGASWARDIENHLRAASHFVVLLSERSNRSAMVGEEIRRAYDQAKKGSTNILPVRFTDLSQLQYHLAAMLNGIPH